MISAAVTPWVSVASTRIVPATVAGIRHEVEQAGDDPQDDGERRAEDPARDAIDQAADDRDRDVPEHRPGDGGDDPLGHPVPAVGVARSEKRVDGADQPGEVDHQEERQEDRGDEREDEAEPADDDADQPAGGVDHSLGDLLRIRLNRLRRGAVRVHPRPERRARR